MNHLKLSDTYLSSNEDRQYAVGLLEKEFYVTTEYMRDPMRMQSRTL
jgi:hypothetical protein